MAVQESGGRVRIRRIGEAPDAMSGLAADARRGLAARPRSLSPKYLYDARGSELFEEITRLPEYYQTRTERALLERIAEPMIETVRPRALVEFGSGSASKTRVLLDVMERHGWLEGFGAVEVSESALRASARGLLRRYPELRFEGLLEDFTREVVLPFAGLPRLVLFLGSTIGNLRRAGAVEFLRRVRRELGADDRFLIGFDLVKDRSRLEAAYDDAQGVTAAFNLNLLRVLNRELLADFPLEDFEHRAIYNEPEARIEMYLVARRDLTVRLRAIDMEIRFEAGESILTELSHKYTRESALALLAEAGLALCRWDVDPERLFALGLTHRG